MTSRRWHVLHEADALILARRLPARFDIAAAAVFPPVRKLRLASQVRQDLWRALRHVRGFSPVIRVEEVDGGLWLRAGGRVAGPAPRARLEAGIAALLADTANRARWLTHAGAG